MTLRKHRMAWLVGIGLGMAGSALAADGSTVGDVLKDAAGQATKETIDKTLGSGKDQSRMQGESYDNRRDGRGDQDNPGQGSRKDKDKKDKKRDRNKSRD